MQARQDDWIKQDLGGVPRSDPTGGPRDSPLPKSAPQVAGTIRGVIDDLSLMTQQLGSGADAGKAARMLERLSRELSEAAQMLRVQAGI
jgi:hypothetical protein